MIAVHYYEKIIHHYCIIYQKQNINKIFRKLDMLITINKQIQKYKK